MTVSEKIGYVRGFMGKQIINYRGKFRNITTHSESGHRGHVLGIFCGNVEFSTLQLHLKIAFVIFVTQHV